MSKIYLHFGAHKCASTTIQRTLRKNLDKFRLHGIGYLESTQIHREPLGLHFRNLAKGRLSSETDYEASLSLARESALDLIASTECNDVLISYEGFCGASSLDIYGGIYRNQLEMVDSIRRIFEGFDLSLTFVIRRQDNFIESCYLQQIREGRYPEFEEFKSSLNIEKLSWVAMLDQFYEEFGDKFHAFPFELIKCSGGTKGFVSNFLASLGLSTINACDFEVVNQANVSLSAYAVGLYKEVVSKVSSKNKAVLRTIFAQEFPSSTYGKAQFFSDFDRSVLLKALQSGNEKVVDFYFMRLSEFIGVDCSQVSDYWLSEDEG